MREAVIVSAVRTAVGKANKGALAQTRPEDMGKAVLQAVVERVPGCSKEHVEDVIIGCAMPEGQQGLNVSRIMTLDAGFPVSVPAMTINRFCASGLQSVALAAERVMLGYADMMVAGGVESMSVVPMTGHHFSPHPRIVEEMPEAYIGMGHTAENVARQFDVSREDQDRFALSSHRKAAEAVRAGRFREEIVALQTMRTEVDTNGKVRESPHSFDTDESVRPDTTLEALAALRPAFAKDGTVTAGNASPMSDGAAAVLVMSREKAEEIGAEPLATFRGFAVKGVEPAIMGVGPVEAIPAALKAAGKEPQEVRLYEINEAFASQCLHVIRTLELEESQVNVNGGAIALGHPLGCTGAKLTTSLIHELRRRGGGTGVVSLCVGGGMGAAGVLDVHA